MAFGHVGSIANGGNSTNDQTSLVLTTTVQALAGTLVLVYVAVDNNDTVTGDGTAVSGVVDSAGNTYTRAKEYLNSPGGAAQDGVDISIWYAVLGATLNTSSTITASFTSSTTADASAGRAVKYTIAAGAKVGVEGTPANATGTGSLDVTTANIECLRVRATGVESNANTNITPTSTWTVSGQVISGGGTASTEVTFRIEWLISTATGAASAPTSFPAGDAASIYVAFKELPLQTVTPSLFANTSIFATPVVTPGSVAVTPTKFANTSTFGTQVVTSSYEVTPTKFSNTSTFFTPVTTVGDNDVLPSKFTNTTSFKTPVVTGGAISVLPSKITNTSSFGTPVLTTTSLPYRPQVRSGMWRRHMGW